MLKAINLAGAASFGLSPEEMKGRDVKELSPGKHLKIMRRFRQVLTSGQVGDWEYWVEFLPGEVRWYWFTYQPLPDFAGGGPAIQVMSFDITDRKEAEAEIMRQEKLAASNTALKVLLERMSEERKEAALEVSGRVNESILPLLRDLEIPSLSEAQRPRLAEIREKGDYAAIVQVPAPFVHLSQYLRGCQEWFMDFIAQPARLEILFDYCLEYHLVVCRRILEEIGQEVDMSAPLATWAPSSPCRSTRSILENSSNPAWPTFWPSTTRDANITTPDIKWHNN